MKKIIFLVFLVFSNSAFSFEVGYIGLCSEFKSNLLGYCKIISSKNFTPVSAIAENNGFIHDYYYWIYDLVPSDCVDGSLSFFRAKIVESRFYYLHSQCEIDISYQPSMNSSCDPSDDVLLGSCHCPNFSTNFSVYFEICSLPSLSSSQETKIKENDLISESNSKLGSIASSNSTNTDLLNKIKNSLSALLSTNFAVFGTGAASSNPLNKDDVNSPEYAPTPISSEKDLSDISPLMSQSGSCPADISISVMNSNHHLSYQPLCDFADKLHPLVIAAARVSAAWLVIGAL
jgi:hypothetical protein